MSSRRRCQRRSSVDSLAVEATDTETETEAPSWYERTMAATGRRHPTWMMLDRVGDRRDGFRGDRTTSSTCHTSNGDEVSVSLNLAEPPGTSVLTLDWPDAVGQTESTLSYPYVIAADGNVVLFQMSDADKHSSPLTDYFVYKAGSDPSLQQPSLSLLPARYHKRNRMNSPTPWFADGDDGRLQKTHSIQATGILSCSDDEFVVAELEIVRQYSGLDDVDVDVLWLGQDRFTVHKRLHVRGVDLSDGLSRWSPHEVLPFDKRFLIWVDYYMGMIVADMAHPDKKPRLLYVPLPVVCLEASFSLSVAGGRVRFVYVDRRCCSFSITMWTLLSDWCTWRTEAVIHDDELRGLRSGKGHCPRVRLEFPVIDMEDPDVVYFMLNGSCGSDNVDHRDKERMVRVHMKKKVIIREGTGYSGRTHLSDSIPCASELPRYLYGAQGCRKRRKLTGQEYEKPASIRRSRFA